MTARVGSAAGRTVAAGTARLFFAWCTGPPVPQPQDRRCEGVADLAGRRARVWDEPLLERMIAEEHVGNEERGGPHEALSDPLETVYDGPNVFTRVADRWTAFFRVDREGPRGHNDPLWPLDALFGARDDVVELGREAVRGVAVIRWRLTVDLAQADAVVPAGVSVPAGPYRQLRAMPAEVWLDAAGLARRIAVVTAPLTAPADAPVWAVSELWDFGVAADITQPRPDEVAPPHEVFRQIPGSSV